MLRQEILSNIISIGIGIAIITTDMATDVVYRYAPISPEEKTIQYIPKKLAEKDITRLIELSEKDYETVIEEIKTPEEAQFYIMHNIRHMINPDSVLYGKGDYWASFKWIHHNKRDDCDGGALAAAALLHDDGYPTYLLRLFDSKKGNEGHMVFLFEDKNKKFYSLGYNPSDNILKGKDSIEELVSQIDNKAQYEYEIIDISKRHSDFINNDINNKDL